MCIYDKTTYLGLGHGLHVVGVAVLVDGRVGQVHGQVGGVGGAGLAVGLGAQAEQALVIEVQAQGVAARDEHVQAQVELEAVCGETAGTRGGGGEYGSRVERKTCQSMKNHVASTVCLLRKQWVSDALVCYG